jgi:hypothetical protein
MDRKAGNYKGLKLLAVLSFICNTTQTQVGQKGVSKSSI